MTTHHGRPPAPPGKKGSNVAQLPGTQRSTIDWPSIRLAYEAGVTTDSAIAREHAISRAAIHKRAKRDGWSKDLSVAIRTRADAKVARAAVARLAADATKVQPATEKAIVEANATQVASVRLGHRKDIALAQKHSARLLGELQQCVGAGDAAIALISLMDEWADSSVKQGTMDVLEASVLTKRLTKLEALVDKVAGLPVHIRAMKDCAETLTKLVQLERQAFGIVDATEPERTPRAAPDPTKAPEDYYRWLLEQGEHGAVA